MSRNRSVRAVLFVCCFRLFTAFLINDERKLNDTSSNFIPEHKEGATWKKKNLTICNVDDELPPFFDWSKEGGVTPVKDQGQCNSCWAFSSVAAIESQWKIHTKQDIILSEQFLIDCNHMGAACSATNLLKTYADVTSALTGVLKVNQYRPYDGNNHSSHSCDWEGDTSQLMPVTGFRRVKPGNEVDMVTYLYHNGPLSAGINDASMINYDYTVNWLDRPTQDSCPNDVSSLNHAILIVGYGVDTNQADGTQVPYWIIKNSWGTEWGDQGYYYLERGINACGIANDVIFPFVP